MVKLWGIDLGGTKIEGAILDPDDLSVAQLRLRVPTEAGLGYEKVLESIGEVVRRLEEESGQKRPAVIGVGTPGVIEPSTSVLKNSNTTCLNGKPLLDDLRGKLGVDVRMANDANCFALAEATLGCARGEELVMGLILGRVSVAESSGRGRSGMEFTASPANGGTIRCSASRILVTAVVGAASRP